MIFVCEVQFCLIVVDSSCSNFIVCMFIIFWYPCTWLQYPHKYLFPIICIQNMNWRNIYFIQIYTGQLQRSYSLRRRMQPLYFCNRRFKSRWWHVYWSVVCCVGSGFCNEMITCSEGSYRVCVCVYFVCLCVCASILCVYVSNYMRVCVYFVCVYVSNYMCMCLITCVCV